VSDSPGASETFRRSALPALLFALLVAVVYSPALLSSRNFAGRDLLVYHLPIEKAVHDAYGEGSLPLWAPEISGGRPLAANPNVGAFYPLRPLLALVPFPAAIRIFPVFHWILAGLGVMVLLRAVRASRAAAWIGAVTYAFSGVAVSEVFFPNIHPGMALLPWIVWAVERRSGSAVERLLVLSVLFGLLLLAGDVFTTGIAIFSGALWILLERDRADRGCELVSLGLALLLAGLLAAPQIVATALWIPDTNRAILGMRLSEAFTFSVSPLRLLELVVPYPFGPTWSLDDSRTWGWPAFGGKTVGFFTTLYAGALSAIALAWGRKWRPPGARFARSLFAAALAAAVVPSLLPRAWGSLPSPLPLRFPEKFAVGLVLGLAILSGLSVDRFREGTPRPRWVLGFGALLVALAAGAALFPDRASAVAVGLVEAAGVPPRLPEAPADSAAVARQELPPALAEGAFLWIATVAAIELLRRAGRGPLAASLVLLTAVPLAGSRKIARTFPEDDLLRPSELARFLQRADPENRYRTLGESFYRPVSPLEVAHAKAGPRTMGDSWVQYRQVLYGRGTVFNLDFDVGDFARMESLRRISSVLADRPGAGVFFGSVGLRFGVRFRDQAPIPGYERVGATATQEWDELPGALPDVRLAEAWREEAGPLEAARALPGLARGEIVIESGAARSGTARPGALRVLARTRNRVTIETDTLDPTWLFALRGFCVHRDVRVDGRPAEVHPAQLAFSAVPLPAGRHRVEWTERLPGSEVSRWGPAVFALLVAGLIVRERRSRS
jgi:hypothetical protein